jgi:hypothetical protein
MVPNRTVFIDSSGLVQSVFTARNLWAWPQVILTLKCQPLWQEGLDEQVYIDAFQDAIEHIDSIIAAVIKARISYAMLEEMDIEPLLATARDIWYYSAPSGTDFITRVGSIIAYCESEAAHPEHPYLLGHTYEIVNRVSSAYPFLKTDFWKMLKRIWPSNYQHNPSRTAGIDIGLPNGDIQRHFDNNRLPSV